MKMKSYNEFTQAVASIIKMMGDEYFPNYDEISVRLEAITKNNDDRRVGLLISEKGNKVIPTIYLEEYWKKYQEGYSLKDIVDEIVAVRKEYNNPDIDPSMITTLSKIRDRITCKMLNIKNNESYLTDKPYSKISDLAVVYVVDLNNNMNVTITNTILKQYGITKETLHRIAMRNLAKSTAKFRTMSEMLLEMGAPEEIIPECDPDHTMYVLTNASGMLGANLILDKATMDMVSQKLGGDFIIIPSSIHEVIILPMSAGTDGLTSIIGSVNIDQLDARDVLSNHPYIYSAETKKIRSVA